MAALDGYPGAQGHKIESVIEVTGLNPYVVVTPASPPTGGQSITAATFGLKGIDFCEASGSDNGEYDIRVFYPNGASARASSSVILQWVTAADGVEIGAVDVSDRTVRLRAVGN